MFPNGLHQAGTPGYLSVIEDTTICITWTPYTLLEANSLSSSSEGVSAPRSRPDIYAMRVPLDDVISIRQSFPKFGHQSITIVVTEQVSLTPFYFYEGGVRELIRILQQIIPLTPSDRDPDLYTRGAASMPFGLHLPPSPAESRMQTPSPTHMVEPSVPSQPISGNALPFVQEAGWSLLNNVRRFAQSLRGDEEGATAEFPQQPRNFSPVPLSFDDFEFVTDTTPQDVNRLHLAEETVHRVPLQPALTSEEWVMSFDERGHVSNVDFLKDKIYHGGMEASLRPEVWKFLLKYYPFESTYEERELIRQQKEVEYSIYKSQWQSITEEQESHFSAFRSLKERIDKDVIRTDRTWPMYESDDSPHLQEIYRILLTYSFFNFDIGYVQGMNDLVSILLSVMRDEVDAFWCFKGFMDRVMYNFDRDQIGMHTQLCQLSEIVKIMDPELYKHLLEVGGTNMFFCFKWLLIIFKREFPPEDVQRIWEVLWSDHFISQHNLFICLAMLLQNKQQILEENMEFDDILRHLNSTSETMNAEEIMVDADYLYRKFITICDTKTQREILTKKVEPPPRRRRSMSD